MRSDRFTSFVSRFTRLADGHADDEAAMRVHGAPLLAELVRADDWLDERFRQPGARRYRQYRLHLDPARRFSVVSFVWGPGQQTPIHDHGVWGLVGMLAGAEIITGFEQAPGGAPPIEGETRRLDPGMVDAVSPAIGDVHKVRNAFADRVSISIHVYGTDIGSWPRRVIHPDGRVSSFVSGYSAA